MFLNLLLHIVYVIILLFLRNGSAFKLGDLDISERQLLLELRIIILMDKILLDVLVEHSLPKPCKLSRESHERMSTTDWWSTTIWGKVVTKIRDEILYNGGRIPNFIENVVYTTTAIEVDGVSCPCDSGFANNNFIFPEILFIVINGRLLEFSFSFDNE